MNLNPLINSQSWCPALKDVSEGMCLCQPGGLYVDDHRKRDTFDLTGFTKEKEGPQIIISLTYYSKYFLAFSRPYLIFPNSPHTLIFPIPFKETQSLSPHLHKYIHSKTTRHIRKPPPNSPILI